MSKPNNTTPNTPYGPATGVPTPEAHNEAQHPDGHYAGDSTPGTANHAHPGHADGGPGHADCGQE